MNLIPSQREALEEARTALLNAKSELIREIQSLQKVVDKAAPDTDVSWVAESIAKQTAQLGKVIVARENLWDLEFNGTVSAVEKQS